MLDRHRFNEEFHWFKILIQEHDQGRAFTSFREGVADDWEGYKPGVRDRALLILAPQGWTEAEIGSGTILQRMIEAVEIKGNNLIVRQNRWGPGSSEHSALLDARRDANRQLELERCLFDLFHGADEGATFGRLKGVLGAKYPLLAYLFFLKDMDRFMPIRPKNFDSVFYDLRIGLVTNQRCSWENYQSFNAALREVQSALAGLDGLTEIRLIDAHSFCWMLEKQLKKGRERLKENRDKSIVEMRQAVERTVRNANGQTVEQEVKNKELLMSPADLEERIRSLLDDQNNRCNLTQLPFDFAAPDADNSLRPSVDRIDSNRHYEHGNLQIVCRFVNFWKRDSDNEDFKRLLRLVRGEDDPPVHGTVHASREANVSSMADSVQASTRSPAAPA